MLFNSNINPDRRVFFFFSLVTDVRCANTADITFVLDSSGSIRNEDWRSLVSFVSQVVGRLTISEVDIHVAALRYSTNADIQFRLDASYVRSEVQRRIEDIRKSDGQTDMQAALRVTSEQIFNGVSPGDRGVAPNIMVVISDGRTDERQDTITEANRAKSRGIEIIPVGIDVDGDMALLRSIASDPDDVADLRVTSYGQLIERINSLVNIICPEGPAGRTSGIAGHRSRSMWKYTSIL